MVEHITLPSATIFEPIIAKVLRCSIDIRKVGPMVAWFHYGDAL